jgi:hypothetical protein
MQRKGLIKGIEHTERSEGNSYPLNWPCAICGKLKKFHENSHSLHQKYFWCSIIGNFGLSFQPMDNLDYIEILAKKRNV